VSERQDLEAIWWSGVKRVSGYKAVEQALGDHTDFSPSHILAMGKAASSMARAGLDYCSGDVPCLILTKYEHGEQALEKYHLVELIEAGHPVPDENSLKAGKRALEFVSTLPPEANLLVLTSGGASSLVENLIGDLTLGGLQALNDKMLKDGLDIHAINQKRKTYSAIKSGKLLSHFSGARALSLVISDVEGDDISIVGSGIGQVPAQSEKEQNKFCATIIASNQIAATACQDTAKELGYSTVLNEECLYGDIYEVAVDCAKKIINGPKGLYIFGGEPTTILPENPGEGGRNQALALAMAREISKESKFSILVAGTDGSDGPTGSAGGYVTEKSWGDHGGGAEALKAANSGAWLRESGGLFISGPTGTNVMDLMIALKH
jgi:glycerate 2-kinase